MTPTEIQACYERANNVINGFKKPSGQNARDVVALLKHYSGVQQAAYDTKPKDRAKSAEMPDCFKDLFGFK